MFYRRGSVAAAEGSQLRLLKSAIDDMRAVADDPHISEYPNADDDVVTVSKALDTRNADTDGLRLLAGRFSADRSDRLASAGQKIQVYLENAENGDEGPSAVSSQASGEPAKSSAFASGRAVGWAGAIFAGGLLLGLLLWSVQGPNVRFEPIEGIGVFAILYVLAQAIERLLELFGPLVDRISGSNTKAQVVKERDDAVALAISARTYDTEVEAAKSQAQLDQIRANRTVMLFAIGALLAMAAAGWLHLQFLTALGVEGLTLNPPSGEDAWIFGGSYSWNRVLELVVIGTAIAGGSKPLHDLISKLEKTKEKDEDPSATGGSKGPSQP